MGKWRHKEHSLPRTGTNAHCPLPELRKDNHALKSIGVKMRALGEPRWQGLAGGLVHGGDPSPQHLTLLRLRVRQKTRLTWVSTAVTLVCSTASGSIFFLMARLLTVTVSAFTGCREMRKDIP